MGNLEDRGASSIIKTRGLVVTRRRLLYLSGLAASAVVATACGGEAPAATPPAAPAATVGSQATVANAQAPRPTAQAAATTAAPAAAVAPSPAAQPTAATAPAARQEAPQLADLVRQGKLPPVAERLPKNPVVVQPVERVGKYGGAWRTSLLGGSDGSWLKRTIGYEHLVRRDLEWTTIIPNVAAAFEANADATAFTFTLREASNWSDGQPFTAADIVFWYEDVSMNKELTPSRGNNPPTIEKIDAATVRFRFAKPDGLFLENLASSDGNEYTRYPKHYLQQYHIRHNPQGVEQLARENGAENWVKLFQLKGGNVPGTPYDAQWQNPDLPTLHGWRITAPYAGGATRVTAERNPFYWKIDPAGNQLPYLDRVTYEVAQDREVLVLKALNGEIDMQDRNIATPSNKAVFADNQQKGGYRFFETRPTLMNTAVIALNLTHKDPVKRQLFQNKDFRVGLSHAINRQEIIDVVYIGQGEPWQAAPRKESEFYSERLAKQYTEFDLKRANEHLDKAAPQKDAQGFRLGPDGKRIAIQIEITAANGTDRVDTLQLVQAQWQRVGIDAQLKEEDRSLLSTRKNANEHDAVVWNGDGGVDVILEPRHYFPSSTESNFAQAWSVWYTKQANARTAPEEPPAAPKRQMELYRQLETTSAPDRQRDLMRQILQIAADEFYCIGLCLPPNGYGIVRNNFKNVPKSMPNAGLPYPNPAPTNTSQYFIE